MWLALVRETGALSRQANLFPRHPFEGQSGASEARLLRAARRCVSPLSRRYLSGRLSDVSTTGSASSSETARRRLVEAEEQYRRAPRHDYVTRLVRDSASSTRTAPVCPHGRSVTSWATWVSRMSFAREGG